ncbi:hypothetical protein BD324DRAFT_682363 [Kockovaella imperatae]|uniref:P-loop containing nucleoside triphosphate hydrolase protein n=1 Tax=Kockovaella imperatae TaxID=4999 RepID=A0A1Y1UC14_9TREE|nr:hypothetical protein BD324DRAFT_682363 [Kockovaella imperatae]ORX35588.1 hypothetical protein BD324DRAFT_682363 [Kockovaella imperatae]
MSRSSLSSTSTLLPSPDDGGHRDELSEINQDIPVSISSFLHNVRKLKGFLGPALSIDLGLEIAQVVLMPEESEHWTRYERLAHVQERYCNVVGAAIITCLIALYACSLIFPLKLSRTPWQPIKHTRFHRSFCTVTFLFVSLLILLHASPHILYIVFTHLPAPNFYPPLLPKAPYLTLSLLRNVILVLTLLISGSMRRGPRMQYTPMALGTGFGVNAEKDDAKVYDKALTPAQVDDIEARRKAAEEHSNVLDYSHSCMLSFCFMAYCYPLAKTSITKSRLLMSDLPQIEQRIRNDGAERIISRAPGRIALPTGDDKITRWQLIKLVWGGRGLTVTITLLFESLVVVLGFLQAVSLYEIINSMDDPTRKTKAYPYLMCWALFLSQTSECFLQAYSWTRENFLLHNPVRFTMASLLFDKILRCSDSKSKEAHNLKEGDRDVRKGKTQVVNLLTIDSSQIGGLATRIWAVSNATISLVFGVYVLYGMLGVSSLVGIAVVPLSSPLSFYVSRACYRTDKAWAQARDARISAIREYLNGVRVIKLNGFESYFQRRIEALRATETTAQRWRFTLGTLFNILADQLPSAAIAFTFLAYTKFFGHTLHPGTAFVAINIFNRVKSALQSVPNTMQGFFEALVAIDRICRFLNAPDIEPLGDEESDALVFSHATITWPTSLDAEIDRAKLFKLRDVDVRIPRGKFTLICGPLGSGKTLLLRSLLGEAVIESGSIAAPTSLPSATPLNGSALGSKWNLDTWLDNSVAYAPQQAYIRHGTIQDNILFGQPMWRARYVEALRQASLQSDLALMESGDLTEVGDHGVTLSGGQRARVNLARCLYSRANTVYMDDILSAVDAHTAHFIFNECLTGSLLKNRTVVFVTHHVALCLPGADYIVTLNEGRVEQACQAYNAEVHNLQALEEEHHIDEPAVDATRAKEPVPGDELVKKPAEKTSRQIYTTEHASEGRVDRSHYRLILGAAGGWGYWIGIALLYGLTALFDVVKPWFMRGWSSDPDPAHLNKYLRGWFGLISITIATGAFRWVWLYGFGSIGFYSRGSKVIHAKLLQRIIQAPLTFFESTPTGRIVNIFSQDQYRVDAQVADAFGRALAAALSVGLAFIVTCIETPPLIAIAIAFALPLQWISSRLSKLRADLRRLTSIADSPLITLYNDVSEEIVMIRAFGSHQFMIASMQTLFNRDRQAWCADWQVFNFVRSSIRAIACIFVAAAAFLMVHKGLTGAQVGLVLTFAQSASGGLFGLLEQISNLEQTFVSAERINRYIEMPEQESFEGDIPEKQWPTRGSVEFKNVSVKYADDLPEVLHKVSFKVEPAMRVGIVGATGSGKSTLALTLFRAVEPCEGRIEVDGTDIRTLELHHLRKSLNMVAQDGSLCSGTLRDAIDITGEKDDAEIYKALQRVHLLPEIITPTDVKTNPFANLDSFVAVGGDNFSQGQRQLLCLARALLKQSRVLVMDEATSSVDFEMDEQITKTLKESFADTTIITIAHRLATIMQYDRVLVLNKGQVLEYDSPLNLIQRDGSAFQALCMAQGKENFEELLAMASR